MNKSDKEQFATALSGMAEIFRSDLSAVALGGYWSALNDLTVAAFRKGVESCLRSCRFMPAPAEIRSHSAGEPKAKAVGAWETVIGAIRSHGGWASVIFDDRAITNAVLSLGGWKHLTGLGGDALHVWARKEFLNAYRPSTAEPLALDGMGEEEPVRIASASGSARIGQ